MRRWLDPPEFAREFERACDSREDGTSTWLIDDPVFERWTYPPPTERTFMKSKSQTFDHNALWIRGKFSPLPGITIIHAACELCLIRFRESWMRKDGPCRGHNRELEEHLWKWSKRSM